MGELIFFGCVAAYLACCFAAYCLFWRDYANSYGMITRGDRRFFMFMASGGPVSLMAALMVVATSYDWGSDEVIWRRKDDA